MTTINEGYKTKSGHSVRINDGLVEICAQTGLPLSYIVENCLAYFATLNDNDRIQLLVSNDPDKVKIDRLKLPEFNYVNKAVAVAKENIGEKSLGRVSLKALVAFGLAILATVLLSSSISNRNNTTGKGGEINE